MGRAKKGKIDKDELEQDLAAGMSGKEAAKKWGVTESAISQFKKRQGESMELVPENGAPGKLNPLSQLEQINQKANDLLNKALRSKQHVTAVNCLKELRGQVNTALEIAKTMNDFGAVQDFFTEVLNAIGEIDADVRDKIIKRLKDKHALRQAIDIN